MKFKKVLTYVLAGAVMLSAPAAVAFTDPMTVQAADANANASPSDTSNPTPAGSAEIKNPGDTTILTPSTKPDSASSSKSKSESKSSKKTPAANIVYDRAAEAMVLAARELGLPLDIILRAEAEGKTVGEYMNNAITTLPGLEDITPVAQGDKVILNGEESDITFVLAKPLAAYIDYAKEQATSINGKVMNVANVKTTVSFETATVNFYMPGVVEGQNIQVFRYVNGEWEEVSVSEVREDHVVVDMTAPGVLAFIEVQ